MLSFKKKKTSLLSITIFKWTLIYGEFLYRMTGIRTGEGISRATINGQYSSLSHKSVGSEIIGEDGAGFFQAELPVKPIQK